MNQDSKLEQINSAVSCITFSNSLLDAALDDIKEPLTLALGGATPGDYLADVELNRASAASALGLAGALFNLKTLGDLEALMLGTEFLNEDDADDAKLVKGVMLDCLITEKVKASSALELEKAKSLMVSAAEIMERYGYAGQYLSTRSHS